jgi:hypothetical protein
MLSEEEQKRINAESAMRERETERILPELTSKMWGNGGLRLDTDTLDLTNPRDYHYLMWLSRITSSFVLKEREFWRKPTDDLRHKISEQDERLGRLDNILGQLRELTDDKDAPFDAEKAQAIIKQYRTPLEAYYDEMKAARERRSAMQEWEQELGVEKHTPAEWEEELDSSSGEAKSEEASDEEE